MHVMIDCETLSLRHDAVVAAVAICEFFPTENNTFQELLDSTRQYNLHVGEQIREGRHVCENTLEWWSRQSPEARMCLCGDHGVTGVIQALHNLDCERYWSRGYMDMVWLKSLGWEPPFWLVRDSRTLLDILETPRPEEMTPHDPSHDAAFEALRVQKVWSTLNLESTLKL